MGTSRKDILTLIHVAFFYLLGIVLTIIFIIKKLIYLWKLIF